MKTLKFKLYSNHGNRELHKTIEGHASVWNHCIALQRRYHAIYKKYIHKFQLSNHLVKLKRLERFGHWNQLPSQAIQDIIARIDKAYQRMFLERDKGKKIGEMEGFPNCRVIFLRIPIPHRGWEYVNVTF